MEVDVPLDTEVFDDTLSAGCHTCISGPRMVGSDEIDHSLKRKFHLFVLIESLEGTVAGSELSKIKSFAMKYNADQVSSGFLK